MRGVRLDGRDEHLPFVAAFLRFVGTGSLLHLTMRCGGQRQELRTAAFRRVAEARPRAHRHWTPLSGVANTSTPKPQSLCRAAAWCTGTLSLSVKGSKHVWMCSGAAVECFLCDDNPVGGSLADSKFRQRNPAPQVVSSCFRGAVANLLTSGVRPAVFSKSQRCVSDQLLLQFPAHPCAVPVFQGAPRPLCARHPRWRACAQSC